MQSYTIATFYKFTELEDIAFKQIRLKHFCSTHGIKGTILLAQEGINGTIAGTAAGIEAVINFLQAYKGFNDLAAKISHASLMPFKRLKVRIKKELISLGLPNVEPAKQTGTYVEPKDWNQLLAQPDILLLDTRNQYEVEFGSFSGAMNPKIKHFRHFPNFVRQQLNPQQHKRIAMFCTGGIRCEKASAFMLAQGFSEVYHLKGGILNYLDQVATEQSQWQGECFVFDDRITVS